MGYGIKFSCKRETNKSDPRHDEMLCKFIVIVAMKCILRKTRKLQVKCIVFDENARNPRVLRAFSAYFKKNKVFSSFFDEILDNIYIYI